MNGILLFNKPILWTSHDAVDFVRRCLGQRSVGHAGTLDPLATGLLVILIGQATKRSEELSASDKEYAGSLTLGMRTDTQDLEGRIVSQGDFSGISVENVEFAFSKMTGEQQQVPPRFSAVKKKGKSLYAWSRAGVAMEVEPRKITVSDFKITEWVLPEVHFSLTCSKGTYVRALCDCIGERLGCGATLSSLVRIRSGNFSIRDSLAPERMRGCGLEAIEKSLIQEFS